MRNNLLSCARGHVKNKKNNARSVWCNHQQRTNDTHIYTANGKSQKKETRIPFVANNCHSVEARKPNRIVKFLNDFFYTKKCQIHSVDSRLVHSLMKIKTTFITWSANASSSFEYVRAALIRNRSHNYRRIYMQAPAIEDTN